MQNAFAHKGTGMHPTRSLHARSPCALCTKALGLGTYQAHARGGRSCRAPPGGQSWSSPQSRQTCGTKISANHCLAATLWSLTVALLAVDAPQQAVLVRGSQKGG